MEYLEWGGTGFIHLHLVSGGVKPASIVGYYGDKDENEVQQWLTDFGVIWRKLEHETHEGVSYAIARDNDSFALLNDAIEGGDHGCYGTAFGFPIDAIQAYKPDAPFGKEGNDPSVLMFEVQMYLDGKQSPDWCAYLNHVPVCSRLLEGNVSSSSVKLSKSYMRYIRDNHPKLADEHEKSWRLRIHAFSHHPKWLKILDDYKQSRINGSE